MSKVARDLSVSEARLLGEMRACMEGKISEYIAFANERSILIGEK